MQKVLIVEDSLKIQGQYENALSGLAELLQAYDLKMGEQLYQENSDIALVVMDGCIGTNYPNTLDLIRKIRLTFKGPMIATSADSNFRNILEDAGCDYKAAKDNVPELVKKLLSL